MTGLPRALVTNDDGIDSPGLTALADAVADCGYEVIIAAPARQSSGASASLTAAERGGRIPVSKRDSGAYAAVYAVDAAPAMIALLAVRGAFGEPPALVASGVNYGANVGRAVLHSGTLGAALTAAYHGITSMAVSLDVGLAPVSSPYWDTAAHFIRQLIPELSRLPEGAVANLNVPDRELGRVEGVRTARLAAFGIVQIGLTEAGEDFLRTQVSDTAGGFAGDSDAALLAANYATITAIYAATEATSFAPRIAF